MFSLKDRHVLLLAPKFFDYHLRIKDSIEEFGATVKYFDERPSNSFWCKIIIRLSVPILSALISKRHFNNILSYAKSNSPDFLFIVNPEAITITILQKYKSYCPKSKVIVYMWDSIKNKSHSNILVNVTDKFLSFDPDTNKRQSDAIFLPLFYTPDYPTILSKNTDILYDISFIGTLHSDRYQIADKIKKFAEINGLRTFFFFYSPSKIMFLFQKFFLKRFQCLKLSDVNFKPLSLSETLDILKKTSCLLDIEHPNQKGLTMRTIESIGAKKKLITTNPNIFDYDFYNSNNIHFINRNNVLLNLDFFSTKYENIDDKIYDKYSLSAWIKAIFTFNH